MKDRVIFLDYVRILACVMVVMMHAPLPSVRANGLFLSTLSYFSAPCIGLFFMVSGALLLPAKETARVFLKKRFIKIVYPIIIWSFIYIGLSWQKYDDSVEIISTLMSIPFAPQGNAVFWFMYVLMGLYIITPIISQWLVKASKSEIEFYLILWLVTSCYPFLEIFLSINEGKTGILYYFSGYIGYYVLGFYLKRFSFSLKLMSLLFFLSLGIVVSCKLADFSVDFYRMFWYLSITSVIQCTFWFLLIKKYFTKNYFSRLSSIVPLISNLTFGIYLIHILIMRNFLWHASFIQNIDNYIIQSLLIAFLTLILSLVCTYVISLSCFGGYVVGYKQKIER